MKKKIKQPDSPPTCICSRWGNCNFTEVSRFLPKHKRASDGVAIWRCHKCKQYATSAYYKTGATFNYNIRICDIEGTVSYYYKLDFPNWFVKYNHHLWNWERYRDK